MPAGPIVAMVLVGRVDSTFAFWIDLHKNAASIPRERHNSSQISAAKFMTSEGVDGGPSYHEAGALKARF